ncbi:AAA family ATPase [Tenacibaculum finnmarkense]|uniref:TrlF family AAA-like ATPase n=1 Tax=Tenacibaculum finnmarkense TaxID=2781243 RepID=UPI00187B8176|nr:AAA family ATPase [Tenacibaculum finnmarkense]MBE7649298.1 AAA family ATPase [Tenacibaculum finnmarkense genomovar ulcerans]MCG8813982.1 AAA family ATPase [Tenacibaculum finnmarkense]
MSNKNLTSDKGSIWRKWDLHLHTPLTKLSDHFEKIGEEDLWKTYCDKIENSDVSAFGITDYFSSENYFTFLDEFKTYHPNSEKVFFPNIEFRLDIAVNKQAEEVNIHILFSNELEKTQIDDFLTILKTNHTNSSGSRIACKNLSQEQFVSATINHNELQSCLKEVFGSERPFLILAAVNNAGLRPVSNSPRKLAITDEIDKICDAFFGGRQNVSYCLNTDRYETDEIAKARPVICGCDAHSFDDLDNFLGKFVTRISPSDRNKTEILKDITWIKSDLSFEGLKQIIFEPIFRVHISENKPRKPVRRIENVKFNFPTSTLIQRKNSTSQQDFCLKNLKQPIYFSDYFTCIIGGRGTGKSTIINIIAEKLNEKTDFFKKSDLKINSSNYDIENDPNNYIEITGTNEIEFVSQGKIEKLAEANELTKLIFEERIKEIESDFIQIETDYDEIISKIDENISLLFKLITNAKNKKDKTKEKETIKKIIDSINDERYKSITSRIKLLKQELNSIDNSKKNYKLLLEDLRKVSQNYEPIEKLNEIDIRIQEIVSTIIGLDELTKNEEGIAIIQKEFANVKTRIDEINAALEIETKNLREFFEEKGTNEETIKDSQKASENLSKVTSDLENIELLDTRLKTTYRENNTVIAKLQSLYDRNDALISSNLDDINRKLQVNDENVLDINFTYDFDNNAYKDSLFKEFYNTFNNYHISGTSESRIKEALFLIEPNKELIDVDYRLFNERLNNIFDENNIRKSNNYVKVITDIFNSKGNYLIYLNLIKKHRYNLSKYIRINGFYGRRELESCSFGQRCTAVIVTLLMTGVKPLIIDEPEAHLDNKLVADYLVNLVKQKQLDRQIIFASHNSNFVINGDSALIHILEIPNNEIYTHKTSTTIENTDNREKLLKLEGGRQAFLNRESKYGI